MRITRNSLKSVTSTKGSIEYPQFAIRNLIFRNFSSLHKTFFYLLILLLPIQLGRHFWFDFSYVRGIRIDYLSPTLYLTDILIILLLGFWGLEWLVKKMENRKWKIDKSGRPNKSSRPKWRDLPPVIVLLRRMLFPTVEDPSAFSLRKVKPLGMTIVLFVTLNIFFSISPWLTFYKWIKILEFSLLAFYVYRHFLLSTFYFPIFAITLIYSFLIAIGQFIHGGSLGGLLWWLGERTFSTSTPGIALFSLQGHEFLRPYATFSHPNVLAGYSLIITTLLIGHFSKLKQYWSRFIILLGILSGIGIILLSVSRSVWIVGTVTGVFLAIMYVTKNTHKSSVNKKWNLRLFAIFFFTACILFFIFQYILRLDETVQIRQILNSLAWSSFLNRPIVGTGLGTFIATIPQLGSISSNSILQPVHNVILLVIAEGGFIGLLMVLSAAVALVKKSITSHWMYVVILVQLLSLGMVDHYVVTIQQTQLLLAIIIGMLYAKNTELRIPKLSN